MFSEPLSEILSAIIRQGMVSYNKGDYRGCAKVYIYSAEQTLSQKEGMFGTREGQVLKRRIDEAKEIIEKDPMDAAWAMRRAFDTVLAGSRDASSVGSSKSGNGSVTKSPRSLQKTVSPPGSPRSPGKGESEISTKRFDAIVNSMKLSPNTPDIQRGGCLALAGKFSPPLKGEARAVATRFVKEMEGVDMVLEIMEKWEDDQPMQEAAIRLLCCLTFVPGARPAMNDSGAVTSVSKALERFPSDMTIKAVATPFMNAMMTTMLKGVAPKEERDGMKRSGSRQSITSIGSQSAAGTLFDENISKEQVRNMFTLWNQSLASGDSRLVARRYAKDAVLLPTVSDEARTTPEGIKDYFDHFLALKPQGVILEGHIKIGEGWAQDAGIYEFTLGVDGTKVRARYSFVYNYDRSVGRWLIGHHHSSGMPEASKEPVSDITEDEVQNLFHLWNDALDTGDAALVAKRYAKNAVLLPTVSDEARTTPERIEDYFVHFCAKKPQGVILESHVTIGKNWCKDVGIYEFTMGTDGSKVAARYSFVYVWEDGSWKISHHHSSGMPEGGSGVVRRDSKSIPGTVPMFSDEDSVFTMTEYEEFFIHNVEIPEAA